MIIGIHGPLNGGKDFTATIIQRLMPRKFAHYAFAKPLKEAAKALFGFTDLQMDKRDLKEAVDPFWGFTPRRALQLLGTEFGREMMRKDVWIKRAELEVARNAEWNVHTIITDVRFENEAEWIRSRDDAVLLYLEVPGLVKDGVQYQHASEAGISRAPTDIVIVNEKTGVKALHDQLVPVLTKLFPTADLADILSPPQHEED
jgi:hypothetical protein